MVNADGKISALVGTDASKTAMAVVPVKVWPKGNGTPVITYAFLDNGSSSSFCTEALMRQLGVNGPRTLISLTTLDRKNSLTDSFVLQDLAISDLDENVFVKLPTLYTRPEIPVSKEDIPNQVDIDKWPHLSEVYLPDVEAEVGLLIASDVPQILDPLEVKHCQDGGPYASRTIVGWVVNGPLGCRNPRSRIPSFFVKADHDLNQMVKDNSDHFPREVVNSVNKNFYVDDCLKSLPSTEEALQHASDLRCLLSRGGFRLTKWISNSRRVLDAIPEAERAKDVKNLDLTKEDLPVERALGVRWCIETDTFGFKIDLKHSPPTRRGILSVMSSVYDPLGLAALFVLPAKRLLQDLCREKLRWDDAIPSNYQVSWERWLADLPKLSKFSVERCLKPDGFGVITSSQLHHFADASEIGYGSVSYLRLVNGRNEANCSFLCAKSRVAPLKMITIPRLELSAEVTAVKQDRLLKRELEISVNARSVFWTDSTAVLRYVKNETNRYHTFVANRVAIIHDGSQPNQWFHVNGDNNPADDASRGLTADIFLRQSRWLTGPAFLWKHDSMWPTQDELFGEIANDDPEVKREVRAAMSSLGTPGSPLLHCASRCSSWSLLVKVVAWLFRYKNNLLKASKGD